MAANQLAVCGSRFCSLQGNDRAVGPETDADPLVRKSDIRNGNLGVLYPLPAILFDRLQFEGVPTRWSHGKWNGGTARIFCMVLRFEPEAQARVVNFGLRAPKIGWQSALDAQVIELKFDLCNVPGEISACVVKTYTQPGDFTADT